jgi:hypothetical protein
VNTRGSSSSEAGAAGVSPSSRRSNTLWFRNGTVQSEESVVDAGDVDDVGDVNLLVLALHSDAASAEDVDAGAGTQVGRRGGDRCGTSEGAARGPAAALLSTDRPTATAPLVQPQQAAVHKQLRANTHPAGVAPLFFRRFHTFWGRELRVLRGVAVPVEEQGVAGIARKRGRCAPTRCWRWIESNSRKRRETVVLLCCPLWQGTSPLTPLELGGGRSHPPTRIVISVPAPTRIVISVPVRTLARL